MFRLHFCVKEVKSMDKKHPEIKNQGTQEVKAANQTTAEKKGTVQKGNDLRSK